MANELLVTSERSTIDGVDMLHSVIQSPQTTMSVYCYVVDGLLIDTGAQSMAKEFQSFFNETDFDQVVLTHFHEDHTGNAAYIQQKLDKPIYIHQMAQHLTEKKQRIPLYRQAVWGNVLPFSTQVLPQSFQSRHDDWEVIETPGHSKDHVAFYNRSRNMIFTGDLYVTPRPKVVLVDENVLDTLDSLKKIQQLDVEQMFCCHAGQVKKPQKMIQMKIDYLEEIQARALALHEEGKDVDEISNEIFRHSYPIVDVSHGEWSAVHMIRNFLNHG